MKAIKGAKSNTTIVNLKNNISFFDAGEYGWMPCHIDMFSYIKKHYNVLHVERRTLDEVLAEL